MSLTRIEEEKKKEKEVFEAIEETHPPLLLDSGATAHVHFERKFNQEFDRSLLSRIFQQVHPANRLIK